MTCGSVDPGARPARGRRGRPPQLPPAEREALILDAMERLVAEKGLEGASMAAIARAAGMSKRTLYVVFESRDALFAAWARRLRASLVRPLRPEEQELPLEERLKRLLRREAVRGASDRRLRVLRAVVAEGPRNPDMARVFYREGPVAARRIIREELERARAQGEIALADLETGARILCDMAYPSPLDHLVDPNAEAVPPEAAEARLALALAIFLRGAAPDVSADSEARTTASPVGGSRQG